MMQTVQTVQSATHFPPLRLLVRSCDRCLISACGMSMMSMMSTFHMSHMYSKAESLSTKGRIEQMNRCWSLRTSCSDIVLVFLSRIGTRYRYLVSYPYRPDRDFPILPVFRFTADHVPCDGRSHDRDEFSGAPSRHAIRPSTNKPGWERRRKRSFKSWTPFFAQVWMHDGGDDATLAQLPHWDFWAQSSNFPECQVTCEFQTRLFQFFMSLLRISCGVMWNLHVKKLSQVAFVDSPCL